MWFEKQKTEKLAYQHASGLLFFFLSFCYCSDCCFAGSVFLQTVTYTNHFLNLNSWILICRFSFLLYGIFFENKNKRWGKNNFLTKYCSDEALNCWLKNKIDIQTFVRTASSSLRPHLNNIFIFNRAAAEGQHEQINFKPIFYLNFLWLFFNIYVYF